MSKRFAHILLAFVGFLIGLAAYAEEVKIPKLLRRATDFTNTLSRSELDALELDLARFEDSTSTQIAVVLIPTIGESNIEDVALRIAESNTIGQKKRDNGILLLIAKNDRQMRIEVGYGLEGVLPDGLAGQIIRREITPYFRSGEYYAGVKAGIEAIMLATRNEYKADPKQKGDDGIGSLFFVLFVLFLIFMMMRRSGGGKGGGRGLGTAAALPLLFGSGHRGRTYQSGGWGGGGGGGFGGFSGGGGSFGGGGASGSW